MSITLFVLWVIAKQTEMDLLQNFLTAPTNEKLGGLSKEQLFKVAEHFDFELAVTKSCKKKLIRDAVEEKLKERLILTAETQSEEVIPEGTSTPHAFLAPVGLTFEQQLELLSIQNKERELDRQLELHKLKIQEREQERQFETLRMQAKMEEAKLAQHAERLKLIGQGKLSSDNAELLDDQEISGASGNRMSGLLQMIKLLPRFNDRDPDVFFSLFESLAEDRGWNDAERTLLLQSVLEGKAQEAFISLSSENRKNYKIVKEAVLKAYELVPEAYRRRFRGWRKDDRKTHVEVARELTSHFNRWCTSLCVSTFEGLSNLIVLEQFKNIIPERVAMFVNEHKVMTAAEAAVLADEYVLIHKTAGDSFCKKQNSSGNVVKNSNKAEYYVRKVDLDSTCRYCLEKGHWKKECPVLRNKSKAGGPKAVGLVSTTALSFKSDVGEGIAYGSDDRDSLQASYKPFITLGTVSLGELTKVPVKILRDTGSSESFLLDSKLPFSSKSNTGKSVLIQGIGLETFSAPLHRIQLDSEVVKGEVEIALRSRLPIDGVDLILGNNLAGSKVWGTEVFPVVNVTPVCEIESDKCVQELPDVFSSCAVTRAMRKGKGREEDEDQEEVHVDLSKNLSLLSPSISLQDLIIKQKNDLQLKPLFESVKTESEIQSLASGYFIQNRLLLRKWTPCEKILGDPLFQIVIPEGLREVVLKAAHGDIAGHFGVKKTYHSVMRYFFWPRLKRDVAAFIKTCHVCQLVGKPNEVIAPAPLYPIPVVKNPFEHLTIDCVGPLPPSKTGSIYILTVMCQTTRYPAAYPLRNITTKSVVKALTQFISIFGIPRVIQSDRGTNFTSRMFAQILKQLRVDHQKSSAHHPESQGALERFHQTLKQLLRTYCTELMKDWEEGLPWLLLAAREVIQESLGFSPNDLVFGHKIRGPLALLRDDLLEAEPPVNLLDYVNGFRYRVYCAGALARDNLGRAQSKMKTWFDHKAERREFHPGDQVLVLLPMTGSSFSARFSGPYTVLEKLSEQNYMISTPDRRKKAQLCHVNLLKPYLVRVTGPNVADGGAEIKSVATAVGGESGSLVDGVEKDIFDENLIQPRLGNSEQLNKLESMFGHLSPVKGEELRRLITSFRVLFSDIPSCTDMIQHDIDVGDSKPIRQRFYRVSPEKQHLLELEVKYLLENGLAERSSSSWASPCLLVTKPDGTFRFCTDYRRLNAVTKSDSFPLPRIEDCIDSVGSAKFVTKIDLLKGYYQVPLTTRAQEVCAFTTSSGLYTYKRMSFGLRNAPATFQRLMNSVISGLDGCAVYLDDVVVYSQTWEEHLRQLRALFTRLETAKLTVNLAKCEFARATVVYLGNVVGQGKVCPVRAKVQAIDNFPVPSTKKELMRFLGMIGYYRKFCENFSTVVAPLTDLLKGKQKYDWSLRCQSAFENAKLVLSSAPVLTAPRWDRPFYLKVDASGLGAGAALFQKDDNGIDRPISFFSKKFNLCQRNYSTIEKELLALIWALQHFDVYVGGGSGPVVVFTDHNPLTFLQSLHSPNQRLIRWALFLQSYSLDIRHIRGVDNVVADTLSRALSHE